MHLSEGDVHFTVFIIRIPTTNIQIKSNKQLSSCSDMKYISTADIITLLTCTNLQVLLLKSTNVSSILSFQSAKSAYFRYFYV